MRAKPSQHRTRRAGRVLSATAATAASAVFARHACAVNLNQYYYDVSIYSDAGLTNLVSSAVINQSNPVVNLPITDYLSFGISDVVTNNPNPAAGDTSGKAPNNQPQPANLGLSAVAYDVLTTDTGENKLAPNLSAGVRGFLPPNDQPDYYTTAKILVTSIMTNTDPGDVAPFSSTTGGDVGLNFPIFAGATTVASGTAGGVATLSAFTPTKGNTASVANSTPLFDFLSYQGVSDGTVSLTPQASSLDYWLNTSIGSGTTHSAYQSTSFGSQAGDTVVPIPNLVVNIIGTPPVYPIISLTSTAPATFNYREAETNSYTLVDTNGSYSTVRINGDRQTFYFGINGVMPTAQTQLIIAFEMSVSGSQLSTLVEDINSSDDYGFGSAIASTALANDPFPPSYNLLLTFPDADLPAGVGGTDYVGFDFTQDPNVSGATTESVEITAVPEPVTFGTILFGAVGNLLMRRHKRGGPTSYRPSPSQFAAI